MSQYLLVGTSRACEMNLPGGNVAVAEVVLLGNSHAQMYAPLFADLLQRKNIPGVPVPVNGCPPMTIANTTELCAATVKAMIKDVLALPRVRLVILATSWELDSIHYRANGATVRSTFVDGIDDAITQLQRAGKTVALIGPIAVPGWNVASILARSMAFGRTLTQPLFRPKSAFDESYGAVIRHFTARRDIVFLRPDILQCASGNCVYARNDRPLFADHTHLAAGALAQFAPAMAPALEDTAFQAPTPGH